MSITYILCPVYEDNKSFNQLLNNLELINIPNFHLVAIDDGSQNDPTSTHPRSFPVDIVKLNANYGHQNAIAIGLKYIESKMLSKDFVIVMDSDGEDDPYAIPNLLNFLQDSEFDVVVASRGNRREGLFFVCFYMLYKVIFKLLTGRLIDYGNYMAIKYSALRRLTISPNLGIHFAASVQSSKLRIGKVRVNRLDRYYGVSKMNFISLVLHGFKAVMVFAEDVLVRFGIFSIFCCAISILLIIIAILLKTLGFATPGWFSMAVGILFVIFLNSCISALLLLMLTGVVNRNANINSDIDVEFINNLK